MKNRNLILLIALASLWGPSFLFIKIAVEDFPPFTLVAIRLTLAAVILTGILWFRGYRFSTSWSFWKKFMIMGFFASGMPFVLFSYGEQFATSASASILNGTVPIFVVILAHYFIEEERLTLTKLSGVLLGFVGIMLIFFPDLTAIINGNSLLDGQATIGSLAFILATICYGISIVYGRAKLRGMPPLVGPAAQLICSALMIIPLSIFFENPFMLRPERPAVLSALVLGIFGTAVAYLIYYKLIDSASATFLSLVTYLIPPIGAILGVIFLQEQLGWYAVLGLVVIILGVMIVNGTLTNVRDRFRTVPIAEPNG